MSGQGILNRADIASINENILNEFISSKPADAGRYGIRITSGTSGGNPIMSAREYGDRDFAKYGKSKRVVSCVGSRNAQLANVIHLRRQVADYRQRALLIGINDLSEKLMELMAGLIRRT